MYLKTGKSITDVDGLDSYDMLAAAIVKQAVDDYIRNKRLGKKTLEQERFFNSEWCEMLCGIKGDAVFKNIARLEEK